MDFFIEKKPEFVIARLNQEKLLSNTAPLLKFKLLALCDEGAKNIILDLTHVKYVDSAGLAVFVTLNRHCRECSGKFILVGLIPHIQKLIQVSQLHNILNIVPSLDEAAKYLKDGRNKQ